MRRTTAQQRPCLLTSSFCRPRHASPLPPVRRGARWAAEAQITSRRKETWRLRSSREHFLLIWQELSFTLRRCRGVIGRYQAAPGARPCCVLAAARVPRPPTADADHGPTSMDGSDDDPRGGKGKGVIGYTYHGSNR